MMVWLKRQKTQGSVPKQMVKARACCSCSYPTAVSAHASSIEGKFDRQAVAASVHWAGVQNADGAVQASQAAPRRHHQYRQARVLWQLREGDQRIAAPMKIARALLHTARLRSCGGAVPHVHGRGRVAFADPVEADWRAAGVVVEPDALAEQGCVPRADLNREPSE
jgi:hypothetical protein